MFRSDFDKMFLLSRGIELGFDMIFRLEEHICDVLTIVFSCPKCATWPRLEWEEPDRKLDGLVDQLC
jgi:hypothetical protein